MMIRQTLLPITIATLVMSGELAFADPDVRASSHHQIDLRPRSKRFRASGSTLTEETPTRTFIAPTEAPAGFDNQSNGLDVQGSDYTSLSSANIQALRSLNDNRFIFEETENFADGLGPTYNGTSCTAAQIRTAPLWGLRTRNRLMHDGLTFTLQDAISRHIVQADSSRRAFKALSAPEQAQVLAFLNSL